MTIYVDQMFLENAIMNYIILYFTSKFSGISSKWYRLMIGAIIGSIYVISSYIFGFYDKPFIGIKILLAFVMVVTSFKIKNIKEFFKLFVFFVGITFFIGGASFGLAFIANVSMISEGGVLYVEEFPVVMIALGSVLSFIIGKWILIFLKNKVKINQLLYDIEIKLFDKKIITTALLDSGHSVKESLTGYPVMILEKSMLKEIVPKEVIDKIEKNDFEFEEKFKRRFRIIPVSTVSSESNLLMGFKADECIIHMDVGSKYIKNLVVVGCDRKLDSEGKYFALMGNII